jgi:hypothetical protein
MIIPVVWTGGATYHWWTCSEEGRAEDENSGMIITIHEWVIPRNAAEKKIIV